MAKLRVGGVDLGLMVAKLSRHVVEGKGKLADLVLPGGRDLLVELAPGDRLGACRELPDGTRDAPRDERGPQTADHEGHDGQRGELPASPANLSVHAPLGQADAGDTPFLPLDVHRHRDVVDRLSGLPLRRFLHEELAGPGRALVHRPFEDRAHQLGSSAVGDDLAVPIEDHRVDDVGFDRRPG